ncbi:MAG TPA: M23 family metallopeptidase [Gemmatimonadaceae bacterium]
MTEIYRVLLLTLLALTQGAAIQETPSLTISPVAPAPGAIVRLTVTDPAKEADAMYGEMAGEQVHFRQASPGVWVGYGPIPTDATGEIEAFALIGGESDTLRASVTIPKPPASTRSRAPRALSVSPRFTRPMDAETEARIARENETARSIGRASHETPRMWTAPFLRPRESVVTSRFGSGRMFNGTLTSRHLGVDFRGQTGEPVRAANRGVVALVDNFFLAGNVIYIDHGEGIVTAYFHLSKATVAKGDTVARGERIGLVGATGRVTGPHLHWSARYGAVTVNPLDLITVTRP